MEGLCLCGGPWWPWVAVAKWWGQPGRPQGCSFETRGWADKANGPAASAVMDRGPGTPKVPGGSAWRWAAQGMGGLGGGKRGTAPGHGTHPMSHPLSQPMSHPIPARRAGGQSMFPMGEKPREVGECLGQLVTLSNWSWQAVLSSRRALGRHVGHPTLLFLGLFSSR